MGSFWSIDLTTLVQAAGLLGLFGIVFAESGLLIGFFLPGDSLLFTAGFLASQGYFDIWLLSIGCFLAAVLGDSVGYAFGARVGPRIFRREQSLVFNPQHLARAERFYRAYGPTTIVLARFLPVIRTFAPILAGAGRMRYSLFLRYNVGGAFLWGAGMPWAGYILGRSVPGVDRFIVPIVLAVIVVSFLPPIIGFLREPERRAYLRQLVRSRVVATRWFRVTLGIACIAFGFAALLIPFFPFAWVAFIGLQLLGIRTLSPERLRSLWRRRHQDPGPRI